MSLIAGNTLGRYELLLPVAKGGMAQVWAARLRGTRGFQKLVAIKTILPGGLDGARLERMFLAEAQLAAEIHHPNVVGTLELGEQDGLLYLVMEWVDGEPLTTLMIEALDHGDGVPLPIAVNLIAQACQGLHAAHELRDDTGRPLGVVHRDVSPQNLLVSMSGDAKLVDFGVAKAMALAGNLTEVGEIKGKFSYMAPEQVQAHDVDRRADVFAIGIIAYLLTTGGRHPFRGTNPGETVKNIVSARPPRAPTVFMADYPAAVEAVVMKALQKDRAQRFATAEEMFGALEAALPEALEARFQSQVAAYLADVLGARANLRRAAIRQAQENADRQRAEGAPSSIGSLRALSLDSMTTDSLTPAKHPLVQGAATGEASALRPLSAVWRSKGYAAASVGALALLGAGLALHWAPKAPSAGGSAMPPDAAPWPSAPLIVPAPSVASSASSAPRLPAAPQATASANAWGTSPRR